jgi:hypothetical protein
MKKTNIIQFKALGLFLVMVLLSISQTACGEVLRGSGDVITEEREVPFFNEISVSGAINLFVTMSEDFSVTVEADDNIMEKIITEVSDSKLNIYTKRGFNIRNPEKMDVYVSVPQLIYLGASGATDVIIENILEGEALTINSSGASDISGQVNVSYLKVGCSGASDAKLSGFAGTLEVNLSGSSDMKSYELVCDHAEVDLSGASGLNITVNNSVSGSTSGASDLNVKGSATLDVASSGASSISKR